MNVRVASVGDGFTVRKILSFDLFRWNMRLGFALAPRDMRELRRQKRKRLKPPDLSPRMMRDIGLQPVEDVDLYDRGKLLLHLVYLN